MVNNTAVNANIYFNNGNISSKVIVDGESIQAYQESTATLNLTVTDDNGNSLDFRVSPFIIKINDEQITTKYANGTITSTFDVSYEPNEYNIVIGYNERLMGEVILPNLKLTVYDSGFLSYSDVQEKIDAARVGKTITIDAPVVRKSSEDVIVIPSNKRGLTLDLNGNMINAKGGRVFSLENVAVVATIKNGIITNVGNPSVSNDNVEGRIAYLNNSNLQFDNVNFTDSIAPSNGAAATGSFILAFADESNTKFLSLNDCNIINCSGTFINNVKYNVYLNDNVNFENNNLYLSYSSSWNSLIANGGYLEVKNSKFINNLCNWACIDGQSQALPTGVYGNSFLTDCEEIVVENTTFINNTRGSKAGAIHTKGKTTITDSTFINNHIGSGYNNGGAVSSDVGALTIEKSIFVNNSANVGWSGAEEGTAIYNGDGDLTIKNSIIISNVTDVSAVYNEAEDVTIDINGNY
jgi:hypothetical protein